jgi:hypothetical protein
MLENKNDEAQKVASQKRCKVAQTKSSFNKNNGTPYRHTEKNIVSRRLKHFRKNTLIERGFMTEVRWMNAIQNTFKITNYLLAELGLISQSNAGTCFRTDG